MAVLFHDDDRFATAQFQVLAGSDLDRLAVAYDSHFVARLIWLLMSLEAFMSILPEPLTVMSLPSIEIEPSFFIAMVAEPHLMVMESPASTTRSVPILIAPSSPTSRR